MSLFSYLILLFLAITLCLLVFIVIILKIKRSNRAINDRWESIINLVINTAIFSEEEDQDGDSLSSVIPLSKEIYKLNDNSSFRELLTTKIIEASKSFSGTAVVNLKKLYLQLSLHLYAAKNLKSVRWNIRAKAIQEIGLMDLKDLLPELHTFANDKNELIRIEAQVSILKIVGFSGLSFLDTAVYEISNWNQILLLKELAELPPEEFNGVDNWLASNNVSVVTFALKLASKYPLFSLYGNIINCLSHSDEEVRFHAIRTLTSVYTPDTTNELKKIFNGETLRNQKEIVKTLQSIGGEDDIPFLMDQLACNDLDLKKIVAHSVKNMSPNGIEYLKSHYAANEYPLNQIIIQEGELL